MADHVTMDKEELLEAQLSAALARVEELEEKIAAMERNSDYLSSLIPKAGQSKAGKALIRRCR